MVLGMGMKFSKTIANESGSAYGSSFAQISKWLPPDLNWVILNFLVSIMFIFMPLFHMFLGERIIWNCFML